MKILKGNICQCSRCRTFLEYEDDDIESVERGYGVGTYYGETYIANIITCPTCGNKIEVYDICRK